MFEFVDAVVTGLPTAPESRVGKLAKVALTRTRDAAGRVQEHGEGEGAEGGAEKWTLECPLDAAGANSQGFGILASTNASEISLLENGLVHTPLDKNNEMYYTAASRVLAMKDKDPNSSFKPEEELAAMAEYDRSLLPVSKLHVVRRHQTRDWMKDPAQREMFIVRARDDTLVYMFEAATNEAVLVCDGEQALAEKSSNAVWTYGQASFSPAGSFLTTTHAQGVRLWGNDKFSSIQRLTHRNVDQLHFSPDERYLLTWNGQKNYPVKVHDVRTGESLMALPFPPRSCMANNFWPPPALSPEGEVLQKKSMKDLWPFFSFSHDSHYLAGITTKGVVIYELPSMTRVPYTCSQRGTLNYLPFERAQIQWKCDAADAGISPAVLAIWLPASNESVPCRLIMLEVPSMKVLTSRNVFSLNGQACISWQSEGEYCALLTRVGKRIHGKRRAVQTQLDIVQMRQKDLPVDSLISDDEITAFAFSPTKDRFAVIHASRKLVAYSMRARGLCAVATLENVPREMNTIKWSPLGSHFVVASCASGDGLIWFVQCNETEGNAAGAGAGSGAGVVAGLGAENGDGGAAGESGSLFTIHVTHKDEMNRLVDITWDPSGRFVCSAVFMPIGSQEAYKYAGSCGYTIWSFQGRLLHQEEVPDMHLFQWRPHPVGTSKLTAERTAQLKKKLKDYAKKIEAIDGVKKQQRKLEIAAERNRYREDFYKRVAEANITQNDEDFKQWEQLWAEYNVHHPNQHVQSEREVQLSVSIKPV